MSISKNSIILIIMSRHQHGSPWPSPATHHSRSVFIGIELLHIGSSWSSCLYSSMWKGPLEYVPYEFVPTSPAESRTSGSSNLDSFRDGWWVAVQLRLCVVLPPGLVQYCSQHSCVVAIKPFLHTFSQRPCSASIQLCRHDRCLKKKLRFIFFNSVNAYLYVLWSFSTTQQCVCVHIFWKQNSAKFISIPESNKSKHLTHRKSCWLTHPLKKINLTIFDCIDSLTHTYFFNTNFF